MDRWGRQGWAEGELIRPEFPSAELPVLIYAATQVLQLESSKDCQGRQVPTLFFSPWWPSLSLGARLNGTDPTSHLPHLKKRQRPCCPGTEASGRSWATHGDRNAPALSNRPRQRLLQLWKLIKPLSQQLEVAWDPPPPPELWYHPGPPIPRRPPLSRPLSSTRSRNPKNPTCSRQLGCPRRKRRAAMNQASQLGHKHQLRTFQRSLPSVGVWRRPCPVSPPGVNEAQGQGLPGRAPTQAGNSTSAHCGSKLLAQPRTHRIRSKAPNVWEEARPKACPAVLQPSAARAVSPQWRGGGGRSYGCGLARLPTRGAHQGAGGCRAACPPASPRLGSPRPAMEETQGARAPPGPLYP